ncbi:MAG: SpoIIE family protein phosphatase [Acidobacteriota bacterium]|nr:SpoIIE family protein phosphatase [Acidobacteriota bacterium]
MIRLRVDLRDANSYEHLFEGESLIIGRAGASDLSLEDRFLSRQHARLFIHEGQLMVEDLGSRNGTKVNGSQIEGPVPIKASDQVRISSSTITILEDDKGSGGLAGGALPDGTVLIPSSDLLTKFVGQDAEATRGEDNLRRQAKHLRILNEVHQAVAGSIELNQLLELILDRTFDHLQPEQGAIFLLGDDGEYSRVASRRRENLDDDYLYSRTLVRQVSEEGLAALVLDAQTDTRFANAASILDAGVRSLIAAPLSYAEGSLGMIALSSRLHVRQFTEDDLQLLSSLASVGALRVWTLSLAEDAAERRRMEGELELARKIQIALLPDDLPTFPGYKICAFNTPSRGVSGDFYEVVSRSSGTECVLLLADVSGKGMAASLLTATLEALAAGPILDGLGPDEICNRLGVLLEQRTPPERFATAFLSVLEQSSGSITYASAGHNPCILVRSSGEIESLDRTGIPLGLLPGANYEAKRCQLNEGDTLVVYSDGITEATNPDDEEYGLERLIRICIERCGEDVESLVSAVDRDLHDFAQGEPFADDRTMVVVRRDPLPESGG